MKSKITGGETELLFTAKVLNKFDVNYYKCKDTGFIQTEEPYWLEEAYSEAITKLDVGLIFRNEELRNRILKILPNFFDVNSIFLDYAGGYGVFTRMMRDKGYNFYHTDQYCKNIFAEYFDLKDLPIDTKFELVTAFEVFEHLINPIDEINNMLSYGENILFTTEIQPENIKTIDDWWYFVPQTGQHISLYTIKSLQFLAHRFGYNFYSDNQFIHLFTKKSLNKDPFLIEDNKKFPFFIKIMKRKVDRYLRDKNSIIPRESLLQKDWQFIKDKLGN